MLCHTFEIVFVLIFAKMLLSMHLPACIFVYTSANFSLPHCKIRKHVLYRQNKHMHAANTHTKCISFRLGFYDKNVFIFCLFLFFASSFCSLWTYIRSYMHDFGEKAHSTATCALRPLSFVVLCTTCEIDRGVSVWFVDGRGFVCVRALDRDGHWAVVSERTNKRELARSRSKQQIRKQTEDTVSQYFCHHLSFCLVHMCRVIANRVPIYSNSMLHYRQKLIYSEWRVFGRSAYIFLHFRVLFSRLSFWHSHLQSHYFTCARRSFAHSLERYVVLLSLSLVPLLSNRVYMFVYIHI